jgi:hypothetical protein
MKQTLLDLFISSTLMQGILSVAVIGAYIFLLVTGAEVPETLVVSVGLVLGFFFGSKLALAQAAPKKDK